MYLKIVVILLTAISLLSLSGCNTAQGFGKDIENLGLIIQGKKARPANAVTTADVIVEEVVEQPTGYIVEEPYAQEVIDLSQPVQNGESQYAPEEAAQPAEAIEEKKTAF